jgi:hypothetical protein
VAVWRLHNGSPRNGLPKMRFSLILLSIFTVVAVATPTPEPAASEFHELEARATRSSAGWYSYGCGIDCLNGMQRQLPVKAYSSADNTPDKCIAACIGLGHKVAGLQFVSALLAVLTAGK